MQRMDLKQGLFTYSLTELNNNSKYLNISNQGIDLSKGKVDRGLV